MPFNAISNDLAFTRTARIVYPQSGISKADVTAYCAAGSAGHQVKHFGAQFATALARDRPIALTVIDAGQLDSRLRVVASFWFS